MPRPFDFSSTTRFQARFRQLGACAVCAEDLDDLIEHGHHVIPNQSGTPGNLQHTWLRLAENCVIVCEECHLRVHQNGNFRSGAVAPPSYFTHSHGGNKKMHSAWAAELETRSNLLFSETDR
jgi:hypothetical protein